MFTGLIRDVGTIRLLQRRTQSVLLSIETALPSEYLQLGASVACNGACLTVTDCTHGSSDQIKSTFTVEAGPQTLALTRFGSPDCGVGAMVNLEPALRVGDSLGGHMVSGHVDTLGTVVLNQPTGDGFWCLRFKFDSHFAKYVTKKGSIAVAGVSLTIAECAQDAAEPWVEIMLIPHTLQHTNLQSLQVGGQVELEFDSQAKVVADLLGVMLPQQLKILLNKN